VAGRPTATTPDTVVLAGTTLSGMALGTGQMLVVRDPGGRQYVLTAGHRLLVRDPRALVALGGDTAPVLPVGQGWINAVPAGSDLALVTVPGRDQPGPRVGPLATRVGQVLVAYGVGVPDRYYLVRADGLAPVTASGAALVLGNPGSRAAVRVPAADVAAAPRSAAPPVPGDLAAVPGPAPAAPDSVLCLRSPGGTVSIAGALPLPPPARPVPVSTPGQGPPVADAVYVPPGAGSSRTAPRRVPCTWSPTRACDTRWAAPTRSGRWDTPLWRRCRWPPPS
jgi:hypothetical protein